jgi:hypothetical protein
MFKEKRLTYLTPLEEQQQKNRLAAGLSLSGDTMTAEKGTFKNATTGAIVDSTGNDLSIPKTATEIKIEKAVAPDSYEVLKQQEIERSQDATSQIAAGYENIARQREAATKTAQQNIEQPLQAGMAERIGVRGGFTAGSNAGITGAIPDAMQKAISQDPRVLDAQAKLSGASAKLEQARANISTIGQAQAFAEYDKAKAVADATNATVAAEQKAKREMATANLDFITKNPEALSGASIESIQQVLSSAGIPTTYAAGLIAQAKEAAALKGDERLIKQAELQKTLAEISQIGVEKPTADMQNFQAWQKMPAGAARDAFANATGLNNMSQLKDQAAIEASRASTAATLYDSFGIVPLTYSRVPYETSPDGSTQFDIPTGVNVKEAGVMRSDQCGAFPNDCYGQVGLFGDSFSSKLTTLQRGQDLTPTINDAFLMKSGVTGHMGMVTAVNDDGSIDIADVNADGKGTYRTATVQPDSDGSFTSKGIVGFYNPMLDPKMAGKFKPSTPNDTTPISSLVKPSANIQIKAPEAVDRGALDTKSEMIAQARANGELTDAEVKSRVDGNFDTNTKFGKNQASQATSKILNRATELSNKVDKTNVIDPTSQSILSQTGLSQNAFLALTGQLSKLPRDANTRTAANKEMEAWARKNNIDTSTFAAEYEAYNSTVKTNIVRNNQAKVAENELLGTIANLRNAAQEAGLSNLNKLNVLKIFAGKELNTPAAETFKVHLTQLRNELSMYNAATAGQINADGSIRQTAEAEMRDISDNIIQNGFAAGSIDGFEKAIKASQQKLGTVLRDSIKNQQNSVWSLFGVTKPSAPAFDVQAALKAGYTQAEIDAYLKNSK